MLYVTTQQLTFQIIDHLLSIAYITESCYPYLLQYICTTFLPHGSSSKAIDLLAIFFGFPEMKDSIHQPLAHPSRQPLQGQQTAYSTKVKGSRCVAV